jgi:hypothetical protein
MKRKNGKFYALWGKNGVGVVTSWEKAEKSLEYLWKGNCEKADDFWDAKELALENYNDLSGDYFEGPLPLDYVLFRREINRIKKLELNPWDEVVVIRNEYGAWFEKGEK